MGIDGHCNMYLLGAPGNTRVEVLPIPALSRSVHRRKTAPRTTGAQTVMLLLIYRSPARRLTSLPVSRNLHPTSVSLRWAGIAVQIDNLSVAGIDLHVEPDQEEQVAGQLQNVVLESYD